MRRISLFFLALAAIGWALTSLLACSPEAASAGMRDPVCQPADPLGWCSAGKRPQNVGQDSGGALPVEEDSWDLLDAGPICFDCPTPAACGTHCVGTFDPPRAVRHSLGSLVSQHVRLQI